MIFMQFSDCGTQNTLIILFNRFYSCNFKTAVTKLRRRALLRRLTIDLELRIARADIFPQLIALALLT